MLHLFKTCLDAIGARDAAEPAALRILPLLACRPQTDRLALCQGKCVQRVMQTATGRCHSETMCVLVEVMHLLTCGTDYASRVARSELMEAGGIEQLAAWLGASTMPPSRLVLREILEILAAFAEGSRPGDGVRVKLEAAKLPHVLHSIHAAVSMTDAEVKAMQRILLSVAGGVKKEEQWRREATAR